MHGIRPTDHLVFLPRGDALGVVKRAFSDPTRDGQYEVNIVTETWHRRASPEGLELVAEDAGAIIGHVLVAVGDLDGTPALGIAPLSVAPERQGQGIGTALMEEVLIRIDKAGWLIAVLLGEPRYYSRFGFLPADRFGIIYGPGGADNPHFTVRVFSDRSIGGHGEYTYCWERPNS